MRFIQVCVDGTINVIEREANPQGKYSTLLEYLHPDHIDREHSTNLAPNIWMVEDDAYQYVKEDEWDKYTNHYAERVDGYGHSAMGSFVLFKVGDNFYGDHSDFDDIEDLTEEEVAKIKEIMK